MNDFYISVHTRPPNYENIVTTVRLKRPIVLNMPNGSIETITSISLWDSAHPNESDIED